MPQAVPDGWSRTDNALTRTVQRADFIDALAFVLEIGRVAEAADHHPDIDIRYRTLNLSLSTHSAGHTVTDKDYALAGQINAIPDDSIRTCAEDLRRRFKA